MIAVNRNACVCKYWQRTRNVFTCLCWTFLVSGGIRFHLYNMNTHLCLCLQFLFCYCNQHNVFSCRMPVFNRHIVQKVYGFAVLQRIIDDMHKYAEKRVLEWWKAWLVLSRRFYLGVGKLPKSARDHSTFRFTVWQWIWIISTLNCHSHN